MDMRKHMQDLYKVLSTDETLLRLLYYIPENANDSPLSPDKKNILSMDELDKWTIIEDGIKTTPKLKDLETEKKCRVLFYPSRRDGGNNYLFATQKIIFDVLVHFDFENTDLRLEWICDRLNDLLFNQRITGFGKVVFDYGNQIPAPENYLGYRLIYKFTSEND